MATYKILDTGYIKPENTGTQATTANRANAGTAITIKLAEFTPALSRNISIEPDIGANTPSEINLGSLDNMKFQFRCILNPNTDASTISALYDCVATHGYKLIWYNYTNATTEDNAKQLLYQIATNSKFGHTFVSAELTKWSISTAFYHIHAIFNDIQVQQTGDAELLAYTLQGVVLPATQSQSTLT